MSDDCHDNSRTSPTIYSQPTATNITMLLPALLVICWIFDEFNLFTRHKKSCAKKLGIYNHQVDIYKFREPIIDILNVTLLNHNNFVSMFINHVPLYDIYMYLCMIRPCINHPQTISIFNYMVIIFRNNGIIPTVTTIILHYHHQLKPYPLVSNITITSCICLLLWLR